MYLVLLRLRYPLYCKQDIFIFYIQWLIFLLIGNTMKPRFYVSTSKSIIKALINMHSFEIQLSPIG
ncbi:hypothetical protein EY727_28995 [Klebsiella pneumoniae]|nr:hypothetical protein EY727_28995 [Klebsiella pneumoniae]KAA6285452.1 hypothetical protein EY759_28700 [Klebsiella pneumoniae]